MSNAPGQYTPDEINHVFANLQPHDVEQFYAVYQQWLRQHNIANLQAYIETLRNQIAKNNLLIKQVQPSSIALSSLARLQSNGVTDLDLLDRMLDQGEAWLDSAMQHLDYCERFDFIRGNYTEWCEHALEGAYDWIDSMQKLDAVDAVDAADTASNDKISTASTAASTPAAPTSPQPGELLNEATEEIFLQKLMSEEDLSLLDTAQEIAVVPSPAQEEALDTPTEVVASSVSIEPVPLSAQIEQQPATGEGLHNASPAHHEQSSAAEQAAHTHAPAADSPPNIDNIAGSTIIPSEALPAVTADQPEAAPAEYVPANTVDTAETSATPHLPLERAGTTEPKEVEHETVAAEIPSDEVVVSPATPVLEEATAPLIPTVTPSKGISDVTTIPIIPAAEASLSKNTEPAAEQVHTIDDTPWQPSPPEPDVTSPSNQRAGQQGTQQTSSPPSPAAHSPRKRNFLQLLFSIFFRRKPGKYHHQSKQKQ
jgi:hypothetical protein